jgi:hypothetical protein
MPSTSFRCDGEYVPNLLLTDHESSSARMTRNELVTESASPQNGHGELVRAANEARSMSPLPPVHGSGSLVGSGAAKEKDHELSARSIVTKRSFPGQFES